jgi:ATP-dependent exoDNAse (exonuclease V) beta subunit
MNPSPTRQGRNVSGFAAFLEKLLETGKRLGTGPPDNFAENAVRIMSVHKSKGWSFLSLSWPN